METRAATGEEERETDGLPPRMRIMDLFPGEASAGVSTSASATGIWALDFYHLRKHDPEHISHSRSSTGMRRRRLRRITDIHHIITLPPADDLQPEPTPSIPIPITVISPAPLEPEIALSPPPLPFSPYSQHRLRVKDFGSIHPVQFNFVGISPPRASPRHWSHSAGAAVTWSPLERRGRVEWGLPWQHSVQMKLEKKGGGAGDVVMHDPRDPDIWVQVETSERSMRPVGYKALTSVEDGEEVEETGHKGACIERVDDSEDAGSSERKGDGWVAAKTEEMGERDRKERKERAVSVEEMVEDEGRGGPEEREGTRRRRRCWRRVIRARLTNLCRLCCRRQLWVNVEGVLDIEDGGRMGGVGKGE
ncbi:hypothetical protein DFP72DRAFT_853743 [Ephemerocybe angulata]|uniref:Uncharacterized protein n=1 Tax=Ephemerocybe angulata TaxID=980116 RepID=A0A8H6HKX1_9AGAR|nr:hypothetical protein DFP72DRAFT_853743 [Tulosesus angulatus]